MEWNAGVELEAACLGIQIVATNGKNLTGLAGQLKGSAVVGCAVGETNDEAEAFVGFGSIVEFAIPISVNVGHDIVV